VQKKPCQIVRETSEISFSFSFLSKKCLCWVAEFCLIKRIVNLVRVSF
jgi:hypothetical protein